MSLFMRDANGNLIPVNPGLPIARGNQGGMGRRLSEAELMSTLPDADIAGAVGPGVVPGGEQSMGARRAKLEPAEAASPPSPTYRPLGGAQVNNRGNVLLLTPTDSAFHSVCETSKNTGEDAELITVTLGLDAQWRNFPLNPAPLKPPHITGRIEWGIGNATFSADFDWLNGTSLQIMASYIRVKARYDVYTGFGTLPDCNIQAAFGYGGKSHTVAPARLSVPFNIAGGASSDVIPVPEFATGFTIVGISAAGAGVGPDLSIRVNGAGAFGEVALYRYNDDTNAGNQTEGQFALQNGAHELSLTNNLVDAYEGTVIFVLAL